MSLTNIEFELVLTAVGRVGTYDPDESLYCIEEMLTAKSYDKLHGFLSWCHKNGKSFGHGNLDKIFQEYKKNSSNRASKKLK
jgi:hypothetical protein